MSQVGRRHYIEFCESAQSGEKVLGLIPSDCLNFRILRSLSKKNSGKDRLPQASKATK